MKAPLGKGPQAPEAWGSPERAPSSVAPGPPACIHPPPHTPPARSAWHPEAFSGTALVITVLLTSSGSRLAHGGVVGRTAGTGLRILDARLFWTPS